MATLNVDVQDDSKKDTDKDRQPNSVPGTPLTTFTQHESQECSESVSSEKCSKSTVTAPMEKFVSPTLTHEQKSLMTMTREFWALVTASQESFVQRARERHSSGPDRSGNAENQMDGTSKGESYNITAHKQRPSEEDRNREKGDDHDDKEDEDEPRLKWSKPSPNKAMNGTRELLYNLLEESGIARLER